MFQAERGWNWCQWRGNQITIWWKLGEFWNNNSLEINDPLREAEQIPNASSSTAQVQIASLCQSSGTATRVTSPWTLFTPAATSEVKMFMKLNCGNFREERKKVLSSSNIPGSNKDFCVSKKDFESWLSWDQAFKRIFLFQYGRSQVTYCLWLFIWPASRHTYGHADPNISTGWDSEETWNRLRSHINVSTMRLQHNNVSK